MNHITLYDHSQLPVFLVKNLHTRSYWMAIFRSAGLLIWLWGWGGRQGDRTPINCFLNTVRGYYFFCITRNPVSGILGLVQLVQPFLSGGRDTFPGNSATHHWTELCLLATWSQATGRLGTPRTSVEEIGKVGEGRNKGHLSWSAGSRTLPGEKLKRWKNFIPSQLWSWTTDMTLQGLGYSCGKTELSTVPGWVRI